MSEVANEFAIVSARTFAVPAATAFRAFSDATLLASWWGPKGFTDTIHEFDFRVGGRWRHTMHAPDGQSFDNDAVFAIIEAPHHIAFDHNSGKRHTLTYESIGTNETRVSLHMTFDSQDSLERAEPVVVPANEENFDRLATVLETLVSR